MKVSMTSIKVLFFVLAMFLNRNCIYAEDTNRTLKVLWQRQFGGGSSLTCSLGAATFNKTDNRLFIVGTSFHPKDCSKGEFWFWEVDQMGKMVKKMAFKQAPKDGDAIIELDSKLIKGLAASHGEIFAVARFDASTQSFMKMGRRRKIRFNKHIAGKDPKKQDILILKMIKLPDDNFLLVGRDFSGNGLIIKVDLKGNKVWERTYDSGRFEFFTDGAPVGDEGGFLVVGSAANYEESSIGPSDIWILRCDQKGNIVTETFFPGNPLPLGKDPQVCQLDSGKFVLAYDKNLQTMAMATDLRIRAFSPDLKVLWEKQVLESKQGPPILFKIVAIPEGGFVVGNCVEYDDLRVYQYGEGGNKLGALCIDNMIWLGNFSLACIEDKAFVVSQTLPKDGDETSKVRVTAIALSKSEK